MRFAANYVIRDVNSAHVAMEPIRGVKRYYSATPL